VCDEVVVRIFTVFKEAGTASSRRRRFAFEPQLPSYAPSA